MNVLEEEGWRAEEELEAEGRMAVGIQLLVVEEEEEVAL